MKLNYDQKVYAARVELDSLGVDIYKLGAEICQSLSLLEAEIRIAKRARGLRFHEFRIAKRAKL